MEVVGVVEGVAEGRGEAAPDGGLAAAADAHHDDHERLGYGHDGRPETARMIGLE